MLTRSWRARTRRSSDRPYGDRAAEVADPFRNQWLIATHVEDVT